MTFQASNKRIAKNTIILYMRQILIMLVSLYTVRVTLRALGADDYGLYNVVAGFVAMFNVVSGAFSVAISRFMAYVIGEGDEERLWKLFSTALFVQCSLGVLIVSLLATIGVWYVADIMSLPEGRESAALWVLFFSAVSFFINLISVPYNALIISFEHIRAYAYIAILEAMMMLGVAFAIILSPFDKLITYSSLTVLTAITVRFCYSLYCGRHFPGCRFRLKADRNMLKAMMSFVGWTFLGNGAVVLRDQGLNMILNLFGGTTVNAARAISQSVNAAVQSFANNFTQAAQPQITKLKAANQPAQMRELILASSRISYFLMLILSAPLIKNIDCALRLWLGSVPAYTGIFVILTLVHSMMLALTHPLLYGILASGNIKVYEIFLAATSILSLPIVYGILGLGATPPSAYVVIIIARIIISLLLIWQSKVYGLRWKDFLTEVSARVLIVTFLSAAIAYAVNLRFIEIAFLRFLSESALIFLLTGCAIFWCGLLAKERRAMISFLRAKVLAKLSQSGADAGKR